MVVDFLMVALYLIIHFVIMGMAVLIALWLYTFTEWLLGSRRNRVHNARHPFGKGFTQGHE